MLVSEKGKLERGLVFSVVFFGKLHGHGVVMRDFLTALHLFRLQLSSLHESVLSSSNLIFIQHSFPLFIIVNVLGFCRLFFFNITGKMAWRLSFLTHTNTFKKGRQHALIMLLSSNKDKKSLKARRPSASE
jgi:hypothetical protein